jgi:type IV secretory pathway TraG/TraD family ATPase VirD4
VADFFMVEFPNLSEKTRSIITSGFTAAIDLLNRGVLTELFGNGTNIDPTAIEQGKIIVVAMPIKTYGQVGLIANALWKLAFMRSIERRDTRFSKRPVFLFQDEAQYLALARQDQMFTSTSRSSRVANVILTQSVSGLMSQLGGMGARSECDSWLSNFSTKFFHSNSDSVTNEYASNLIGRSKDWHISGNNSYGGPDGMFGGNQQTGGSAGISEVVDFEVQPREFTRLRTGGRANKCLADAIVFRSGVPFKATDRNYIRVTLSQNQK